jgi:cytochrome c
MKKQIHFISSALLLSAFLLVSCKKESEENFGKPTDEKASLGKELFEGKGNCIACHKPDVKVVGPSLQDITKTYKDKKLSIIPFLKGNQDPVIDPSQFEIMKANFVITKTFSPKELKAVEDYIFSFSK